MTRVRAAATGLVVALTLGLSPAVAAQQPATVAPQGSPTPDPAGAAWRTDAPRRIVLGTTREGRAIVAQRLGRPDAPATLLVVGQMHGDEPKGRAVVARLRRTAAVTGVQIWTISTINPDGSKAFTRTNSRGVDLNRNFPYRWGSGSSAYPVGRRAASERETRITMRFLGDLRPDLILSLHQAYHSIDDGIAKNHAWVLRLSRLFGLPAVTVPCRGPCVGTLTGWYTSNYPGYAVTVELPSSRVVTTAKVAKYTRAIRKAARLLGTDRRGT